MSQRTCTLDGCSEKHRARGLCSKHYQRSQRTGTTEDLPDLTPEQRRQGKLDAKKRYRERNRDRLNAERRAYRLQHLDHERQRCRDWHVKNPGRNTANTRIWRGRNLEHARANNQAWYLANREWSAEKSARRRALMRATQTERVDFRAILATYGMTCHLCRKSITHRRFLHFDHVIPLARGGPHTAENIRPSHALCNQRKGAKMPTRRLLRR